MVPLPASTRDPRGGTVPLRDASPMDHGIPVTDPWGLAYADAPLSPAEVSSFRARMTTDATSYLR